MSSWLVRHLLAVGIGVNLGLLGGGGSVLAVLSLVYAMRVNLIWAQGAGTVLLDAESPSSINCGSVRQLGANKRQKL